MKPTCDQQLTLDPSAGSRRYPNLDGFPIPKRNIFWMADWKVPQFMDPDPKGFHHFQDFSLHRAAFKLHWQHLLGPAPARKTNRPGVQPIVVSRSFSLCRQLKFPKTCLQWITSRVVGIVFGIVGSVLGSLQSTMDWLLTGLLGLPCHVKPGYTPGRLPMLPGFNQGLIQSSSHLSRPSSCHKQILTHLQLMDIPTTKNRLQNPLNRPRSTRGNSPAAGGCWSCASRGVLHRIIQGAEVHLPSSTH